ncbi:hypothetical protein ACFOYU_00390 [Microvirga sp. GCM10011540]|uniref:hypothetical protein n=1 Tax=Microvirga sp. GCM10011540 TaxID=3317338 RepID=UPI0036077F38
MRGPDLVERLWVASEYDEGIPPAEAQALFIEAAEMIEMLRALLEPVNESSLEDMRSQGNA